MQTRKVEDISRGTAFQMDALKTDTFHNSTDMSGLVGPRQIRSLGSKQGDLKYCFAAVSRMTASG